MLDSTKTRYYYYSDNWQVLAEYNGSGTLQAWYAYGNYIDEVLLMSVIPAQAGIQNFYYLHDHLYSPAALLDSSGSVVERYEYDAYGTIRFLSPNYELRTTSSYGNCIAFTGREIDQFDFDAGTPRLTKMHYRHREYSPFMGRFLQRDPLGVNPAGGKNNSFDIHRQYIDGLNLYEYVKENPIIGIDPQGLDGDWNRTLEKFTWWYIHESEKGAWWEGVLPKCPLKLCKQNGKGKFENPDPSKWNDPQTPWSMEERLHPGIKISMRSKTNKEHSNQCTYNIQGDLYLDPSMSGTVDWIAPNSIERHLFNDVYPIHWAVYLDYGIEMHVFYGPHTPTSVGYYMNLYYKVRPLYKE
jgi:RHS repeat-associated protein